MSNIYWDKIVNEYKQKPKEYPLEYGEWAEPYSEQLAKVYKQDDIVNAPVLDEVIEQVEARLDVKLPPSYLDFLKYSNGLLLPDRFTNLLPLESVDWFYKLNKEWVDIWTENTDDKISNEEYFVYGSEQDTCKIRVKYLKTALQISDSAEGDVLLLNPEIRFGEEWEAWWFGNALAGAIRFQSFKELLEYLLIDSEINDDYVMSEEAYEERLKKDKDRLKTIQKESLENIVSNMLSVGVGKSEIVEVFEKELEVTQSEIEKMLNMNTIDLNNEGKIEQEDNKKSILQKLKKTLDSNE